MHQQWSCRLSLIDMPVMTISARQLITLCASSAGILHLFDTSSTLPANQYLPHQVTCMRILQHPGVTTYADTFAAFFDEEKLE